MWVACKIAPLLICWLWSGCDLRPVLGSSGGTRLFCIGHLHAHWSLLWLPMESIIVGELLCNQCLPGPPIIRMWSKPAHVVGGQDLTLSFHYVRKATSKPRYPRVALLPAWVSAFEYLSWRPHKYFSFPQKLELQLSYWLTSKTCQPSGPDCSILWGWQTRNASFKLIDWFHLYYDCPTDLWLKKRCARINETS